MVGRRPWEDKRLAALAKGGPKLERRSMPTPLRRALAQQPLPPGDVIKHLRDYDPTIALPFAIDQPEGDAQELRQERRHDQLRRERRDDVGRGIDL